jgi:shikimate kinase
MQLPQNIILIGFMASGKTVLGRKLAENLGWEFLDTDTLIEKKVGKKIKDIFLQEGEKAFRAYETDLCRNLGEMQNKVVCSGGGIILIPENVNLLKKAGKLIYLKATAETVFRRVVDYTSRPLLDYADPEQRMAAIKKIMTERDSKYASSADATVDTNDDDEEKNVKKIMKTLEK